MTLSEIRTALQQWLVAIDCLPESIQWENSQPCDLCPPFVRPVLLPGVTERLDSCRVRFTGLFQVDLHMPTGLDKATNTDYGPFPAAEAADCILCAALWGDEPQIDDPVSGNATKLHLFDRAGNQARARPAITRDGHYIVGLDIPYQIISCSC